MQAHTHRHTVIEYFWECVPPTVVSAAVGRQPVGKKSEPETTVNEKKN